MSSRATLEASRDDFAVAARPSGATSSASASMPVPKATPFQLAAAHSRSTNEPETISTRRRAISQNFRINGFQGTIPENKTEAQAIQLSMFSAAMADGMLKEMRALPVEKRITQLNRWLGDIEESLGDELISARLLHDVATLGLSSVRENGQLTRQSAELVKQSMKFIDVRRRPIADVIQLAKEFHLNGAAITDAPLSLLALNPSVIGPGVDSFNKRMHFDQLVAAAETNEAQGPILAVTLANNLQKISASKAEMTHAMKRLIHVIASSRNGAQRQLLIETMLHLAEKNLKKLSATKAERQNLLEPLQQAARLLAAR